MIESKPYVPPSPRYKKRRRWPWILAALIIAGGGYYWWHSRKPVDTNKKQQSTVVLGQVSRRDVPVYLTGLGTVQAYNTVTVRAQVDGQLLSVKFREGQMVKAGDVLAQIDPRTYQAAYDQAVATKAKDQANLANAQRDFKRYKGLGDSIPRQTLDTQVATVRQLEAQTQGDQAAIDSAKTQLSYTTIVAPFAGRTGLRQLDAGNVIHASDTNGLVVITQVQPIATIFSLPQQNLSDVTQQMAAQKSLKVEAIAADNSTVLDSGLLAVVDNQIDQTTGTARIKAVFPNQKTQLWPGAFINARLLLKTLPQAMVVPTVAVQQGAKGSYVFVYNEDNTVHMQPVKVSMTEGTDSVIIDGLQGNEQVVVDGMAKLQDKSKVTVAKPGAADGGDDKTAAAPTAAEAEKKEKTPTSDTNPEKHHRHKNGE